MQKDLLCRSEILSKHTGARELVVGVYDHYIVACLVEVLVKVLKLVLTLISSVCECPPCPILSCQRRTLNPELGRDAK